MTSNPPPSIDDDLIEKIKNSQWASNGCFHPRRRRQGAGINDDDTRGYLLEQWKLATADAGMDRSADEQEAITEQWFDRIYKMHTEDTRHYHTPVHLQEMCSYLQILLVEEEDNNTTTQSTTAEQLDLMKVVVRLAIFFHDAVYDAQSATNEEDSARLFESFANDVQMIPSSITTTVVQYILATKKHQVVSAANNPLGGLALFLDLDMAVLGKNKDAYMQYAALIRKEYSFVPRNVYCQKRADVLETFLQQDRIYGTTVMHKALENQARTNIKQEIALLRQGIIPCLDEEQQEETSSTPCHSDTIA